MPVGTRGAVKYLSAADYDALGAEIVLANTYHLMLRPGADVVARFGGLGAFTGWDGLTLTDSGGFQVFSLEPEGRRRRRDVPQRLRRLAAPPHARSRPWPPRSCSAPTSRWCSTCARRCRARPSVVELAVERTAAWAARARAAHRRDGQSLFGIVQGGTDEALRADSARRTVELDFDGYGIGGLSVGETRAEMLPALAAAIAAPARRPPALPDGRRRPGVARRGRRPRRRPVRLRDADPPRPPRHGADERRASSRSRRPATPPRTSRSTPTCACAVCARHSRGYLRHLFAVGEPTAARLRQPAQRGVDAAADGPRCRAAIAAGTFAALRRPTVLTTSGGVPRRSVGFPAGPEPTGPDRNTEPHAPPHRSSPPTTTAAAAAAAICPARDPPADPAGDVLPDDPAAAPADARAAGDAVLAGGRRRGASPRRASTASSPGSRTTGSGSRSTTTCRSGSTAASSRARSTRAARRRRRRRPRRKAQRRPATVTPTDRDAAERAPTADAADDPTE